MRRPRATPLSPPSPGSPGAPLRTAAWSLLAKMGEDTPGEGSMPQTPHLERHFTASAIVRDIVIGMSDGLTVPFALAAGLSGAVVSSGIIVPAGPAQIAAAFIPIAPRA